MRTKQQSGKLVIAFRVTPEVRKAAELAATKERRPLAHWVELAVEEVLIQRGYLKIDKPHAPP